LRRFPAQKAHGRSSVRNPFEQENLAVSAEGAFDDSTFCPLLGVGGLGIGKIGEKKDGG
jgi:hypothetical protein